MRDIIVFTIFAVVVLICDGLTGKGKRAGGVTVYCLMTVFALAIIIAYGSGINVPSPNDALETVYRYITN